LRLIYTKKGESFSDYQINIMLNKKKKETAKMLTTKTEMKINNAIVIAIVQMYIKRGDFKSKNDVVVEYEGNEYYFDDNGFTSLPLFTDYLSQVIKIGESLLVSTNTLRRQQLLC
jgi:hypothetical protein